MDTKLKAFLDGLYYVYHRRELINPDPLYYLYKYDDVCDREVVGLVASSLAYGRVAQIMKSVERVLSCLTEEPHKFLLNNEEFDIVPADFKHRFTTAYDMNILLRNVAEVLREWGTVENFLGECLKVADGDIFHGLDEFSARMLRGKKEGSFPLITAPKDGSACKRLFLFLKWMVRRDEVDPGGWNVLRPSDLVVPVDTHIHQFALSFGFTRRKNADLKCAIEITSKFQLLEPTDPTRYDFVLSRFGLRKNLLPDFHSLLGI